MKRTFYSAGVDHFLKGIPDFNNTYYKLDSSRSSDKREEAPTIVASVQDRFAELHIG